MRITFFASGTPKAQPRVKAYVRGKRAGVYTPDTANEWKKIVGLSAKMGTQKFEGPISVTMDFFMPRPKTVKKGIWHAQKPDIDNMAKAVLDALTDAGVLADDCIVVTLRLSKRWQIDDKVGCSVEIEDVAEAQGEFHWRMGSDQ